MSSSTTSSSATVATAFAATKRTPSLPAAAMGNRVWWNGPFFGRLLPSAKRDLEQKWGWRRIVLDNDTGKNDPLQQHHPIGRLALAWPHKSGPQWDLDDEQGPHIRPYPIYLTNLLDDKVHLAQLVSASSSCLAPPCIDSPDQAQDDVLYFVKHRHGAQGKSVCVYDKEELQEWWERASSKNNNNNNNGRQDFVIQQEIKPCLYRECKFVLRSHILMVHRRREYGGPEEPATREDHDVSPNNDKPPPVVESACYLHETVICQQHAAPYKGHEKRENNDNKSKNNNNLASQISQAGNNKRKLPVPQLLDELDVDHPARDIRDQMRAVSQQLVSLASPKFDAACHSEIMAPQTTCFALLGNDWIMDEQGNLQLCEVNTHPALGWGTMSKVPNSVFKDLSRQVLEVLIEGDSDDFAVPSCFTVLSSCEG